MLFSLTRENNIPLASISYSSSKATALIQPPEAPFILMGKQ
jgi:hypothetical protein